MPLPVDDPSGRNLRFTAAVVLAAAVAREEVRRPDALQDAPAPGVPKDRGTQEEVRRDTKQGGPPEESPVFEFTLLAASAQAELHWPDEGWRDARHLLAARVETARDALRLHLQAEGYAALTEVAGRAARLRSPEGIIDQRFRFDTQGRGLVVLGDSPEVRGALGRFQVWLVD